MAVSDALLERVAEAMVDGVTSVGDGRDGRGGGDVVAWTLSVLAQINWEDAADLKQTEKKVRDVFARVFAERDGLSASGRACLLIAAGRFGSRDERGVLVRNLENGAWRVRAEGMGDTVHWGAGAGYFRAEEGAVESTALSLLALLQSDAAHPLVEPAVNWLMLNRRGSAWQNTRATAFAVLALNRYLAARVAAFPEAQVEVLVNGRAWRRLTLNRDALVEGGAAAGAGTLDVGAALLREDKNTIVVRRVGGASPVYVTGLASVWAGGGDVKAAGHLVATSRDFIRQKVERVDGGVGAGAGGGVGAGGGEGKGVMRVVPRPMGAAVDNVAAAGELVTARVALSVPNALDYVMVTVPKPAGCEPVNALSGWDAFLVRVDGKGARGEDGDGGDGDDGDDVDDDGKVGAQGRRIYREEHDDHSAFFLDHVGAGEWEIRFTMRAVTAGDFRALPVRVEAMYVPEVRANSDARRVRVTQ